MPLQFQKSRSLSEFSTFGIGGPIKFFLEVSSFGEMCEAMKVDLPKLVIGKGSNCLFDDAGFDGLVILNKIDFCHWGLGEVHVGAGYSFSLLGVQAARKGFTGLEFASGIPASVGGAVFMNAGANGKETAETLKSVHYCDQDGIQELDITSLTFSYRTSPFQNLKGAIVSATFFLKNDAFARKKQLEIVKYRMQTQPLKEKSIGCIFRNPEEGSAGALIEKCGLKGKRVGGAKISEKHANFIVNDANASAKDVKELIALVQQNIFKQTGVYLEPEVRIFNAE